MDINKLIYLANYLDKIGLLKEAEFIDNLIISVQDGNLDKESDASGDADFDRQDNPDRLD